MEGLNYHGTLPMISPRIAFSPDGRRVAVSFLVLKIADDPNLVFGVGNPDNLKGSKREVRVWDVAHGKKLLDIALECFPGFYDSLAFSPDGRQLAFITLSPTDGKNPGRLHLWDIETGKALSAPSPGSTPVALAYGPDGRRLAAALANVTLSYGGVVLRSSDAQHKVQIWESGTWKEVLSIQNPDRWMPQGVAFSPDGKQIAVIWSAEKGKNVLSLYDAGNGKELRTIEGVTGTHPVFSPDGRRVACDAAGSMVRVWETTTGAVLMTVRGHERTPAVTFDAEGTRLWTAGMEGTVKEWDQPPAQPGPDGIKANSNFSPVAYAFSKRGTRLARAFLAAHESQMAIRVWDDDKGNYRVLTEVKSDRDISRVQDLVFSAAGRHLAATYLVINPPRSRLKIWDADGGQEIFSAPETTSYPTAMAISSDGMRIAWARDKRVTVWDVPTQRCLIDVEETRPLLLNLAFSPDGDRLAWWGERGVRIWDVGGRRELLVMKDPGGSVGPLTFSPDGKHFAACVGGPFSFTELKVWDTRNGKVELSLPGEKGLEDLAFSPDGSRLATLQMNPETHVAVVKLWDSRTGLLLLRLTSSGTVGCPFRLQFDPDGTRLFLMKTEPWDSGADGFREIWNGTPLPADPLRLHLH
jgi:WD40 repeat protein